jgi:hypothetical protein
VKLHTKTFSVILATGIINPRGRHGKAVASDEYLELKNLVYSEGIVQFANSTHDIAAIFRNTALNGTAVHAMHTMFWSSMSCERSASHIANYERC